MNISVSRDVTIDVLKLAKAIIAKPINWTQGAYARDSNEHTVDTKESEAVCFCSLGAIRRAYYEILGKSVDDHTPASAILSQVTYDNYCDSVAFFNDQFNTTHRDVIQLFDRTIESFDK